ncbi:MAG: hypothetical protein ACLGSA_00990 [Acidobacteriota bacterium]
MFLEEFSLNATDVFAQETFRVQDGPTLPYARSMIDGGASLFLASNLFPATSLRRRHHLERAELMVQTKGPTALYSGESLDQFDQDVFLACLLGEIRGQRPARRSMRELLRTVGRRHTPEQLARLEASLFRLGSARIEFGDSRFGCSIQLVESVLVDRVYGAFRAQASPEVKAAFRDVGDIEALARVRFNLGVRPLTKWLAGLMFVLGGQSCLLDLERLRILCGREKIPPRVFTGQALPALSTLVDMGYIHRVGQFEQGRVTVESRPGHSRANECQLVW